MSKGVGVYEGVRALVGVWVCVNKGVNVIVGVEVLVGVLEGIKVAVGSGVLVSVIVGLGVKDGSRQSGAESLCPLGSRVEPYWSYIFT